MIQISSYQVFDNCIGECVIPATKCSHNVETEEDVERFRTDIKLKHKTDVEQHRAKFDQHKKLTDKEARSAITVYLQYREK